MGRQIDLEEEIQDRLEQEKLACCNFKPYTMAIKQKKGICVVCGKEKLIYALKMCGADYQRHKNKQYAEKQKANPPKKQKPVNKKSKKQIILDAKYLVERINFLGKPENKFCPVTRKLATEIHHKRKKNGYADEWAKQNNIPLFIDKRFFLAVSREGHQQIEDNPEWAYKMGYSIKNNSNEL